MNEIIKIENLKRSYGEITAVNGVSYSVAKGEMFGLVGPDGAGKTTTIRILCGLISPDYGTVSVFNLDISKHKKKIQDRIGYLSQKFSLYGDLSVDENIEFFADINGVENYEKRRDELLDFTRLTPFRNRPAEKLSGGMKQKLALACSLIHKPKIIFLDEPTTGVDPVSRRDFWKILSDLQREGITIFMTTPYLDEAERCNRIALMNKGKIISIDTPQKVKESIKSQNIELVVTPARQAYKVIRDKLNVEVQLFGDRINVLVENAEKQLTAILNLLSSEKITVGDYRIISPSLENVFIQLVKQQSQDRTELAEDK
jgi:ABC-2 type transport system ATP-binding protein